MVHSMICMSGQPGLTFFFNFSEVSYILDEAAKTTFSSCYDDIVGNVSRVRFDFIQHMSIVHFIELSVKGGFLCIVCAVGYPSGRPHSARLRKILFVL